MKKLLCILSVILIAALLCPMTAYAAEDDDVYAVATAENGRRITLADAPDADAIEDLDSYDLYVEDKPVLSVEQADTPMLTGDTGGYFSAEFDLPGTTRSVFLAGLTSDKVEEIQQRLITNLAGGRDFSLIDLSFIDAEKTNGSAADSSLCWAAATANILTYTGWAAKADQGFGTTDDVMDAIVAAFDDKGGSAFYGVGWFIDGVNTFALFESSAASATAGTGGYLKDYAYDQLCTEVYMAEDAIGNMRCLCARLKEGCGIALSHSVYRNGSYAGGHSDTCWGYVADTAYDETDPAYYAGVFITDSDTDKRYSQRRNAPNRLQYCALTAGSDANGVLQFELDLDSQNHAVLEEYYCLIPYSDAVETETSADATRDKTTTPDLYISSAYLDTDFSNAENYTFTDKIESNTKFYYTPVFYNEADKDYSGRMNVKVTLTDSAGTTTIKNLTYNLFVDAGYFTHFMKTLTYNGLPAGDYTVTMTLNENHNVSEAYYYNNDYSFTLKVRDSYLMGDSDNSGTIDIMDATQIQRAIAGYSVDDLARQRGRIIGSELSIMDATQIQRHIATYETGYAIGTKKLYD